jgi:hypothetical protein
VPHNTPTWTAVCATSMITVQYNVHTAAVLKTEVLWNVTLCRLVGSVRIFDGS